DHWSRHPEPATVDEGPAPVVERRKSPGFIFHPRPAPRAHPGPVAEAIRRPSDGYCARPPARTVTGDIAPVAVVVQIFVAGHLARNIVRRIGLIFAFVALKRPVVEIIARGNLFQVIVQKVAASKCCRLVRDNTVSETAAGDAPAPVPYRRNRLAAVFA